MFARSWLMALLTIALCVLFVRLGQWQWQRGEHAEQQREAFLAGGGQALPLRDQGTQALPRFQHVTVGGTLDGEHQFLLDNRSHNGLPGYEVLTPLRLTDGRTLLVDRGWVAFTGSRAKLPDVTLPPIITNDVVHLSGRLDAPPVGGLSLGHAAPPLTGSWPRVTSFPTLPELAASLAMAVEPRILLLDAGAPGGYVRDWQPPGLPPERHWSYAIQWWGFAVTLVMLWLIMSIRRIRARRHKDS